MFQNKTFKKGKNTFKKMQAANHTENPLLGLKKHRRKVHLKLRSIEEHAHCNQEPIKNKEGFLLGMSYSC